MRVKLQNLAQKKSLGAETVIKIYYTEEPEKTIETKVTFNKVEKIPGSQKWRSPDGAVDAQWRLARQKTLGHTTSPLYWHIGNLTHLIGLQYIQPTVTHYGRIHNETQKIKWKSKDSME